MLNLDPEERAKFAALANHWWERDGPCRTLHDINPHRLAYVASQLPLAGARVADIGCGGGVFSEALAAAGATVTAIDASPELIAIARAHAADAGLTIDYRATTAEELAADYAGRCDAVACLELIEHVPDPNALLSACAALLRPGGVLVVATLNRTPAAYLFGVVVAEYVLGLLPRGTHDYAQFVTPAELARAARECGLEPRDISGMAYNPLTRRARRSTSPAINYLASFTRAGI